MDEPFVSLDSKFVELLMGMMRRGFDFDCLNRSPKERFCIFSTHFLERALNVSSKVGILVKGKLVAMDPVGALKNEEIIELVNGWGYVKKIKSIY